MRPRRVTRREPAAGATSAPCPGSQWFLAAGARARRARSPLPLLGPRSRALREATLRRLPTSREPRFTAASQYGRGPAPCARPCSRWSEGGPCTRCRQGRQEVVLAFDSGQAPLRHTRGPAESCFLPDLTRFTGSRCAGPDPQRLVRVVPLGGPCLEREFSPPDVGLGYRAPRAPRLARSTGEATRPRVPSCPLEGCESGRIGTLGKRVWGNSPWVRIPLPPPFAASSA